MSRAMKNSGIEWVGKVPDNWTLKRAKGIFAQRNSKGNQTPVLLSSTQKQGMMPQWMLEGVVQTSADTDLQSFKTVHINDYVISLRSFQGGFEKSNYEGVCSPAYQVFYNREPIDHNYYWLLFKSLGFISKINSLTVGIREGKNIQYKDFANMYLPFPPVSEQQAIANFLDKKCGEIDKLIALQEKIIEELKAYKQSVITEVVTKGLNPDVPMKDSGIEWIGLIPVNWSVCKLKYLYSLINGRAYSDTELLEKGKYRVLRVGNLFTSDKWYYSDLELSEDKYCSKGDLIYGWSASIGATIWKGEKVIYHYHIWKVMTGKNDVRFSEYLLNALTDAKRKDMHGSAMQHLTMVGMNNSLLPNVPFAEQRSIADYLDNKCANIDSLIAIKQSKIEELKEYKKSIIYEYVTGKKEIV